MGYQVHVGSRSALELQGHAHYLPAGGTKRLDLFGPTKLPAWVLNQYGVAVVFTLVLIS